jgi:hypothetical protein
LQRVTRSASDTRYRYYRCRGKQAQVSSGRLQPCPARFSPATRLDELVWADLCAVLQQPQQVAQALERAHSGAWVPQELRRRQATLRSVRASVARQRQRLLEAYLAEVIDLACFQRQDRTLAGQETDLLAREREVTAQGERLVEVRATARSMTQVLEGPRAGLGQASFEQRRQLVELLVDRVVVTDGQVEIRYVIPTTPGSAKTRFCHLRTDYFQVEPAEKAAPPAVDIGGGGAGGRGPQPHRLGVAVAGQVVDLQADQRALDDGELALVVEPAGAVGEPGGAAGPSCWPPRCRSGWSGSWSAVGARWQGCPGQTRGRAWAAVLCGGVAAGWCGQPQDPVAAQASQQLHGQVGQHERQPGDVVAGVADDQDVGSTSA